MSALVSLDLVSKTFFWSPIDDSARVAHPARAMKRFFAELRRRHVIKVAVAYTATAWLIAQLSATIFPTFGAPDWVLKTLIALLVLLFPVALVLAWAFELTPEGVRKTEAAGPGTAHTDEAHRRRIGRVLNVTIMLVLVAVVAVLGWRQLTPRTARAKAGAEGILPGTEPETTPVSSIAVLPFENLSSDPNNAYFAAGIQDEILTDLTRIVDLRVISRESVMKYASHPEEVKTISQELGVSHVLEGSVQRVGDEVRVSVQLIDAMRDAHQWAATYDRNVSEVFAVESEVAQKVAAALDVKLTGSEEEQLGMVPTSNPAAHDAYLQGRAYEIGGWVKRPDLPEAVEAFTRAVTLDSTFALAFAKLAVTQCFIYANYDRSPERLQAAKRAVDRALALAPESGDAQLALGHYEFLCRHDSGQAKVAYERALARLPNNARVEWALGNVAGRQGRWVDALEYERRAMALDPRDQFVITQTAWTYITLRRFGAALELVDRALDMGPDDHWTLATKAAIYQAEGDLGQAGRVLAGMTTTATEPYILNTKLNQDFYTRDYAAASRTLQSVLEPSDSSLHLSAGMYEEELGFAEELAGHRDASRVAYARARAALRARLQTEPDNPEVFAWLGLAEAGLGDREAALTAGRRAVTLLPAAKDAWNGPAYEANLARIEARIGESDSAVAAVGRLLEVPYLDGGTSGLTTALLRIDPIWDPLRKDPRFQALVGHSAG